MPTHNPLNATPAKSEPVTPDTILAMEGKTPSADEQSGLGYLVRHTHRAFARVLAQHLTPHKVSPAQWTVLRALWREDGCSQVDLASRIRVEKASLTTVLSALERQGLIVRERGDEDKRRWYVSLTKAGRQLEAALLPLASKVDAIATQEFTAEETRTLKRLLARTLQNLQ